MTIRAWVAIAPPAIVDVARIMPTPWWVCAQVYPSSNTPNTVTTLATPSNPFVRVLSGPAHGSPPTETAKLTPRLSKTVSRVVPTVERHRRIGYLPLCWIENRKCVLPPVPPLTPRELLDAPVIGRIPFH